MTRNPVPPRLFFLFARRAPVGVILRRGPSRWVQLVRWDTRTDAFEEGQWFHGRIYERRCDLSPDGRLFVYFASKRSRRQSESEYRETWTAVSKPPWLTALALWPKGDAWAGGGAFIDDRTLALNHAESEAAPHPSHRPPPAKLRVSTRHYGGEDSPLFDERLVRDEWVLEEEGKRSKGWPPRSDPPERWAKAVSRVKSEARGPWQIVRRVRGYFEQKGGRERTWLESFSLRRGGHGGVEVPITDAEWAEWDPRGRLVYARAGCICTATIQDDEAVPSLRERVLADFKSSKPVTVQSPADGREW